MYKGMKCFNKVNMISEGCWDPEDLPSYREDEFNAKLWAKKHRFTDEYKKRSAMYERWCNFFEKLGFGYYDRNGLTDVDGTYKAGDMDISPDLYIGELKCFFLLEEDMDAVDRYRSIYEAIDGFALLVAFGGPEEEKLLLFSNKEYCKDGRVEHTVEDVKFCKNAEYETIMLLPDNTVDIYLGAEECVEQYCFKNNKFEGVTTLPVYCLSDPDDPVPQAISKKDIWRTFSLHKDVDGKFYLKDFLDDRMRSCIFDDMVVALKEHNGRWDPDAGMWYFLNPEDRSESIECIKELEDNHRIEVSAIIEKYEQKYLEKTGEPLSCQNKKAYVTFIWSAIKENNADKSKQIRKMDVESELDDELYSLFI